MKLNQVVAYSVLFFIALVLCGLQTTLWYQVFPFVIAPQFWINLVIYLTLERKPLPALLSIYTIGLINCAFTVTNLGLMLMTLFLLYWSVYFVRRRIYWPGSMYFSVMSFIGIVGYNVIFFLLSHMTEENPTRILFFDRLVQVLLTPAFSFLIYAIMKKFDQIFQSGDQLVQEAPE